MRAFDSRISRLASPLNIDRRSFRWATSLSAQPAFATMCRALSPKLWMMRSSFTPPCSFEKKLSTPWLGFNSATLATMSPSMNLTRSLPCRLSPGEICVPGHSIGLTASESCATHRRLKRFHVCACVTQECRPHTARACSSQQMAPSCRRSCGESRPAAFLSRSCLISVSKRANCRTTS